MSTPSQRIVARHVLADAIADPQRVLARFKEDVDNVAKLEPKLPEFRLLDRELRNKNVFQLAKTVDFWKLADPESKDLQAKFVVFKNNIVYFQLEPKFAFQRMKAHLTQNLFLALLQSLSLPPKIRKQVEMCAKFYARSRVLPSTLENAVETYAKVLEEYRKHVSIAEQALKLGQPHGAETQTRIPAGSFTLVNTGGFDIETVTEASTIVAKAEKLMRAIGLGYVCYGDILLTNRVSKASWAAFYMPNKDEMFIRADLKNQGQFAIQVMCHELAHRAHHKFLMSKDSMMKDLFRALQKSEPTYDEISKAKDQIQVGDKFHYKGDTLIVTGFKFNRDWIVLMVPEGLTSPVLRTPLKAYAEEKGLLSPIGKFVSKYAQTAYGENFAEMVATYAMGHLPQDQIEALEAILK